MTEKKKLFYFLLVSCMRGKRFVSFDYRIRWVAFKTCTKTLFI